MIFILNRISHATTFVLQKYLESMGARLPEVSGGADSKEATENIEEKAKDENPVEEESEESEVGKKISNRIHSFSIAFY